MEYFVRIHRTSSGMFNLLNVLNFLGSTEVTVYRKHTHTDQYLSFHSNHNLQHKRAVVNTLLLRADTLVSEEIDKAKEIRQFKQALRANNYPDWMLTIPNTGSFSRVSEGSVNEKRILSFSSMHQGHFGAPPKSI